MSHARLSFAGVVFLCFATTGCALAARAAAGVGARGGLAAGATRGALTGALGARTLGAAGGAVGIEVAAARTAAAGLLRAPSALSVSRATVTARGLGVVGTVETSSHGVVVVRGYGGGTALRALRQGGRVTFDVGGRAVGYSEMRGGTVHHFLMDGATYQYLGYDVVRGNSVLQYAADGTFLVETSLRTLGSSNSAAAASLAALLAASTENRDMVAAVQQDLATLGYYQGPVDGILGYWTRKAIDDAIADLKHDREATRKAKEDAIGRQVHVLLGMLRARGHGTKR